MMFSKSFKEGFAGGFKSPFDFFSPIRIERPEQYDASVKRAWSGVGRAIRKATKAEGAIIEQKTGIKKRRHKDAA